MAKKPRLKSILPLAAVAMFASVSVSNAAPVVYNLTVDGGSLAGTLTFDTDFAPTSTTGTIDTYTHPNAAIVGFSFTRDGSTEVFDQTDNVFELFLTMATADDEPLSLKIDIDDIPTEQFIFVEGAGLDFGTGLGQYQPGAINVTGAALTAGSTTPAADPEITSITSLGSGNWELKLKGEPSTAYEFFSSTTLDFTPGTLVDPLVDGVPAVGTVAGTVLTTDSNGDGTVRLALAGPSNYVRAQAVPPVRVFFEDFEDESTLVLLGWDTNAYPADTATTTWDLGTPSIVGPVPPGVPLPSASNCVGTNLAADYGFSSDIGLRTPPIDLISATGATLTFQHWVDIDPFPTLGVVGDKGTVRVLDASDLSIVLETLGTDITGLLPAGWVEFSAGFTTDSLGESVVLEFLFVSDNDDDNGSIDASGWYIDDVEVKRTPAP